MCCEILTSNYAIQKHIRNNEVHLIKNAMQMDNSGDNILFEKCLALNVNQGKLAKNIALENALDPDLFLELLSANSKNHK